MAEYEGIIYGVFERKKGQRKGHFMRDNFGQPFVSGDRALLEDYFAVYGAGSDSTYEIREFIRGIGKDGIPKPVHDISKVIGSVEF